MDKTNTILFFIIQIIQVVVEWIKEYTKDPKRNTHTDAHAFLHTKELTIESTYCKIYSPQKNNVCSGNEKRKKEKKLPLRLEIKMDQMSKQID